MQQIVHYFLHFVFPLFVAIVFFRSRPIKAYFIMLLTMLVDLDHLLATPVFDPCRCSIGFHPLHTVGPIIVYGLLMVSRKTCVVGTGLLLHMLTDGIDCLFILG